VTLRYFRGKQPLDGGLAHEDAFLEPVVLTETATWPGERRSYDLDRASADLKLRGPAAWAGFWVVTDGATTGFARDGERFTLPGNHVDTFRGAFFTGLESFYFAREVPKEVSEAFQGGPVKGGGSEFSVPAERLWEFAHALSRAGWTLKGRVAEKR
jgi:hypothetical protein